LFVFLFFFVFLLPPPYGAGAGAGDCNDDDDDELVKNVVAPIAAATIANIGNILDIIIYYNNILSSG
jgi:hypothetical protein